MYASADGSDNSKGLSEILYQSVVQAKYSLEVPNLNPGKQPLDAEYFRDFLLGFNQGSVRAAEVVYADTFLLAYGVGYSDGFRDGYSKGYAEGYRAGYSAGWGAGWAAAPRRAARRAVAGNRTSVRQAAGALHSRTAHRR